MFNEEIPAAQEVQIPTNILVSLTEAELQALTIDDPEKYANPISTTTESPIKPDDLNPLKLSKVSLDTLKYFYANLGAVTSVAQMGALLKDVPQTTLISTLDEIIEALGEEVPLQDISKVEAPFVHVPPIEAEEQKNNSELNNNTYANVQLNPVVKTVASTKEDTIDRLDLLGMSQDFLQNYDKIIYTLKNYCTVPLKPVVTTVTVTKEDNLKSLGISIDNMEVFLQNYDTIAHLLENGCTLTQVTKLSVMKFSQLMFDTLAQEKFIIKCNEENAIVNNKKNIETSILEYPENQENQEYEIIGNSAI